MVPLKLITIMELPICCYVKISLCATTSAQSSVSNIHRYQQSFLISYQQVESQLQVRNRHQQKSIPIL
ncbi:Uncharacterized protein BM_BM14292 [Brugia malayi]|uniref:Bm14292 n=1 Tax=Brugia malayi TaxID=6279 RepID=A0A0K0J0S1_BRUMA|nr:Uncharacterized protein BM_BM14292 [Brugia malayi]CDQ00698.1 Bm14292 [Brugia malayi]VIO86452.1 Uncharacterized protein BM_BM14292 [Brugia malayi]